MVSHTHARDTHTHTANRTIAHTRCNARTHAHTHTHTHARARECVINCYWFRMNVLRYPVIDTGDKTVTVKSVASTKAAQLSVW